MSVLGHSRLFLLPSCQEEGGRLAPRIARFAVILLLCLSITLPVITLSSELPWFKVEQLALPVLLAIYLWLLLAARARPVRTNGMFLVAIVYAACVAAALFYGWAFLGHTVIARDFYEIPKALFPLAFFTLGLESSPTESSLRRLLACLSMALLAVCLYAWAQWMDLGISHALGNLYSGGSHDEGSLAHYRRVYSTLGNPNLLGQLLTWAIAGFTLAGLFGLGNRLRNLALIFACLVTVVMTGSRYAVVTTGLALLVVALVALGCKRRKSPQLMALLLLVPLAALIAGGVARSNPATGDRLESLGKPLEADSLRARLDHLWKDAAEEFLESPVFGHGPSKTIFSGVVTDSEYLDVLKEFGAVGFCVYLGYFLVPLGWIWAGVREARRLDPRLE